MCCVRSIQPSDLSALVELCAEHADYEKVSYVRNGKAERLRTALFETPQRLYAWVVERDEGLVGYATATLEFSTWDAAEFLHMDCLYLKPEIRGQGLGKQLVREVIKLARQKNCVNVQWQTPDWNTSGMNFYKRLGATSKDKVRFFLNRDAIRALSERE